ncbi:MAG: hypothetical protein NTU47_03990 [Ignavibacteriales bacterium]|nr:hypothetical protein [Ignavibacteriales bacterium]
MNYHDKKKVHVTTHWGHNPRFSFALAAAVVLTTIVLAGCADIGSSSVAPDPSTTNPPLQQGQTVSFANQVSPIFQRYGCYGCHGGSGGLFVATVAQLVRGGDHGPAVVPGKADTSILVRKLSAASPFGDRMPQGGPFLPDSTLQTIKSWINQGAKDN